MKMPKCVQVLRQCEISDEDKEFVINNYKNGGVPVDDEMLSKNNNAKPQIPFVSTSDPDVNGLKYKLSSFSQESGNWLYCGKGWYVRELRKKYNFARYLSYDTKNKVILCDWDDRIE